MVQVGCVFWAMLSCLAVMLCLWSAAFPALARWSFVTVFPQLCREISLSFVGWPPPFSSKAEKKRSKKTHMLIALNHKTNIMLRWKFLPHPDSSPAGFLSSLGASGYWNHQVLHFVRPSPWLQPPPLSPKPLRGKPRLAKPCKHSDESPYQQRMHADLPSLLD